MASKIPVGVNIIASEQVTKVFDKVRASIQKVFSAVHKGPRSAATALEGTAKAVETTQAALLPEKKLNDPGNKKPGITINGGGFGALQKPAQVWASGMEGAATTLRNFLLLLVGSGGITYGIKRFSDSVSDSVVDLNRLGNRVGMPTKDIRELGFVARAASIPVSTLSHSLTSLADAQFDKKLAIPSETVKAISALNSSISHPISLLNPDGTKRNLKKVFFDAVRGLGEVNDPTLKAKIASQLLGGEEVLKLGDMGPGRLKELSGRFQVSPFSKELVDEAFHYNAAVADMDQALDKLKFTAGSNILKGFTEALDRSSALISQNSSEIQRLSTSFAEKLPKALPTVFSALGALASSLKKIDDTLGLVNITIGALGTYMIAKLIIMAADLRKAILVLRAASLGTTLIAAAPVVAGAALVGGLGYAAYKTLTHPNPHTGNVSNYSPRDFATWRTPDPTIKKEIPSDAKGSESLVRIVFENAPHGMRIVEKNSSSSNISVELGLNMGGAF